VSRPGLRPGRSRARTRPYRETHRLWLDGEQLPVIDATEPNYRRAGLPEPVTVSVAGIGHVADCHLYVGRHGCLADDRGVPFPLTGQSELIARLLADLPVLARLIGTRGPEGFVARIRQEPGTRSVSCGGAKGGRSLSRSSQRNACRHVPAPR